MLSRDRKAHASFALVALASVAGMASADAHEDSRDRHDHQTVHREAEARQTHRSHPAARAERAHALVRSEASHPREHSISNYQASTGGRSSEQGRVVGSPHVHEFSGRIAAGQVHVVRYGNNISGTVDRAIRPGYVSRTFVGGGHVLYTHVYQAHVWHQFGRAFAYETFVPAVRYPAVYYRWALAPWPRPVVYTWGWQVQPWYPRYGFLFAPYPVYTSPDLWMTDYIIAQSMQSAYQTQSGAPGSAPAPAWEPSSTASPSAPASDSSDSTVNPGESLPTAPNEVVPPPGAASIATQSNDRPPAPQALPPAITPEVKAQLNAQIKVQLQEQQEAAVATPAVLTTQNAPPALRPGHVFFEVVQPINVPLAAVNGHCSLSPNDYIKRTGGMSQDDWMIPVVVELSRPGDCPEKLQTRIGLNDLNAMENEQEARVMEAMRAASKSMGPDGPPSGPGAQPTLVVDGSAAPDPGALDKIQQAR